MRVESHRATPEAPVPPPPRSVRPRRGTGLGLLGAALLVGAAAGRGRARALDRRVFEVVNGDRRGDGLFRAVTELGSLWASLAAGAAVAVGGRRREAVDAVGAASAMWVLGQVLKRVYRRTRPYDTALGTPARRLIAKPSGASWPSSHPAVLVTFVTVACRDLGLSRTARAALAALAGLVGVSRVRLGVHYPADVVGGLLLGRAVADAWSRTASPRILG